MSVRIDVLRDISNEDLRRLIVGYETTQRYEVTKQETAERTTIDLRLADLPDRFEKRWTTTDAMADWYRGVLREGLSFGAWRGDELVGIALTQSQHWQGIALVWELHVQPDERGRGTGRALLEAVEGAAVRAGLRAVSIETQTPNVAAIGFYRACGYDVSGVELRFYSNADVENGEVALFMVKPLASAR